VCRPSARPDRVWHLHSPRAGRPSLALPKDSAIKDLQSIPRNAFPIHMPAGFITLKGRPATVRALQAARGTSGTRQPNSWSQDAMFPTRRGQPNGGLLHQRRRQSCRSEAGGLLGKRVGRTKSSCKQPGSRVQTRVWLGDGHRGQAVHPNAPGATTLLGPVRLAPRWLAAQRTAGSFSDGRWRDPGPNPPSGAKAGQTAQSASVSRNEADPSSYQKSIAGRAPFSMQRYGYDCNSLQDRISTRHPSPYEPVEHSIRSQCSVMIVQRCGANPDGGGGCPLVRVPVVL